MPVWTWTFSDAEGRPTDPEVERPERGFGSQADAESWVGENWRALLAAGVEQAHLSCDGQPVNGPLALRPAE